MKFSHVDQKGKINMVSVAAKDVTNRSASAYAEVKLSKQAFVLLKKNEIAKGDVLLTAKLAGIMGGKRTSELIPLCHNIPISKIDIDLKLENNTNTVIVTSYAETNAQTGIEMEALTAVSIAALTIYDMCKAVDRSITINKLCLLKKTGGKSGTYERKIK